MDAFTTAIKSRDAEAIASAFAGVASLPPPPDARALALGCNVCSHHRKNEVAHEIYALGKRAHGVAAMRAGGLFLNQLLYACCREASMLDKALEVWADLQAAGEVVEAEPVGKLIMACLAKSKYDDAFGAFLAAIDGGKQPAAPVCTALVRVCAVAPRLAQSCYAVFLSMGGAGMALPAPAALGLLRALLKTGTAEQAQAVYEACKGDATANDAAKVAQKVAEANKAAAAAAAPPTPEATLAAHTRAALEKNHPGEADRALAALAALDKAGGEPPSAAALAALCMACCRTRKPSRALGLFGRLRRNEHAVEKDLLNAIALSVGDAVHAAATGSGTAPEVAPEDAHTLAERLLKGAHGGNAALTKSVATALLRVCCAAGHLAAARGVLKKMCEQEEPKIMPGAALLTTYLLACGRPASVARAPLAALDAFEKLKGFPSLTPEKCGEIWASCLAPTAAAAAARAAALALWRSTGRWRRRAPLPTPPPHRAALGAAGERPRTRRLRAEDAPRSTGDRDRAASRRGR